MSTTNWALFYDDLMRFLFVFIFQDRHNITMEDSISKLRIYVTQHSAGDYQCVAWLGAAALASIPAKLLLANITVDTSVNPRLLQWKVPPGNNILISCGEVISSPLPVWNFYKYVQ